MFSHIMLSVDTSLLYACGRLDKNLENIIISSNSSIFIENPDIFRYILDDKVHNKLHEFTLPVINYLNIYFSE